MYDLLFICANVFSVNLRRNYETFSELLCGTELNVTYVIRASSLSEDRDWDNKTPRLMSGL